MTRWGVAGTGGISVAFAAALQQVEGAEIVAVGSRDSGKARRFVTGIPGQLTAHGSYESLMNDPNIDIVYIATPASHHYRHTMMALDAGKHVLVEKPMAVNAAQANLMRVKADALGLFLMEAMWYRALPSFAELRRILDDGLIGEVRMVSAAFGGRAEYNARHTAFRMDLAGGSLLHGGIYPIQLAHAVLGVPDRVEAGARFAPSGVDVDDAVVLGWPRGQLASLTSSIGTTLDATARIYGTEGMIVIPGNFTNPSWLEVHYPGKEPLHADFARDRDRLAWQIDAVHQSLTAGHTVNAVMTPVESCAIMGTMDRVREAIGLRYPSEAEAL